MALLAALAFLATSPAKAQPTVFDFDTGTPALTTGQNVPFDQTSGGVTAHFSAVSGGFSIQTDTSSGLQLSQFSGQYLYFNSAGSVLEIRFSQPVTNIGFTFATADYPPIETPTPIRLVAYANSAGTPPVGSTTARGAYGADTLPMGTLSFAPATPFDLVQINIQPGGGTGFLLDNLAVQAAGVSTVTIETSASPAAGGTTSGGGTVNSGASVTVVATANAGYAFVNWTEGGTSVSSSASYTFNAGANRLLVANFALQPAPRLSVVLTGANMAVLSWPAASTGFVLKQNTNPGVPNWVPVTNAVNIVGDQAQVVVTPLPGNCFYRLTLP